MVKKNISKKEINIEEELIKSLSIFRKSIMVMAGDAPISVLCLPKTIENVLTLNGCLRVYDLFNRDLTKIKGIGKVRSRYLASSLDQFLSMGV